MVNYSTARPIIIENVEHSIHILGVQAQAMIGCFWAFLIMLTFSPLFAPLGAILAGVVARLFFVKEQEGRPITFEKYVLNLLKKFPLIRNVFPSLSGIILSNGVYHGS